ncbi:uncharacterized protein LOC111023174 [Momordica charantia]|uniref:Uncharacterized protein LOC111023174 n=1 Tax=Momordica charantia TaxID=3673 RepID=A0A6J1DRJ4_MOMCH|nr:uncharacterized protein LOC111023174 [Momordica charantia]
MCPLRFILVFLSAVLAGYVAWRSASSSSISSSDVASEKSPPSDEKRGVGTTIQNGFWIFVDMASGRYLWRNLNGSNQAAKVESN